MERFRKLVIPSRGQVLTCAGLAVVTLLVIYRNALLQQLLGANQEAAQQSYLQQLAELTKVPFVSTLVIIAFWAVVGLVAYAIYLAISNAIVETRNEVIIDTEYANRGKQPGRFQTVYLQLAGGLGLILLLVATGLWLLPLWFSLFENLLFSIPSVASVVMALLSIIGLSANYYGLWTLGQLTWDAEALV
jgi:hypothetical protein